MKNPGDFLYKKHGFTLQNMAHFSSLTVLNSSIFFVELHVEFLGVVIHSS